MTQPLHIQTPTLRSEPLSARYGTDIYLKMEALQPTGSFKLRGIGHACQVYASRGVKHFVSSSGGNAGIAAAYAGQALGIQTTVVVPETTTARAIAHIQQYQAEVLVSGASWQEANALAETLVGEHGVLLHPFDDPLLWEGHATLIDEVVDLGLRPDAVVVAVGGGGLLAGVAHGLISHNLGDTHIFCAETAGAASLLAALENQRPVALNAIDSIATSLGARQVCQRAFDVMQQLPTTHAIIKDRDAVDACLRFLDEQRILVEPACGAALAALEQLELGDAQKVLVVVCGGVVASLADLKNWDTDI